MLSRAQELGYFRPITYKPVSVFDTKAKIDQAISKQAIAQLREDRAKGLDHILMARVGSIERANEVFRIYQEYAEFNPVQIHTGIKSIALRNHIRQQIINKQSQIVVCVDMLGEGFDLPELKSKRFMILEKV